MLENGACLVEKPGPISIGKVCLLAGCVIVMQWVPVAAAARADEVRVSQRFHDVSLVTTNGGTQPANMGDAIPDGAAMRTGPDSRAEIVFGHNTRVRPGANTMFVIKNGGRDLELNEGVLLLEAPKGAGHVKVEGGGVGAVVKQATAILEFHTTSFKFLALGGTSRLYRAHHLGDSVLVKPGQLVIGNPKTALSDPVDFDVGRFVKTCRLMSDFGPVGSEALLAKESQEQARAKTKKVLIDTNLVIFGEGSLVTLTDPNTSGVPNPDEKETTTAPQPTSLPASSMQLPRIDDRATTIAR